MDDEVEDKSVYIIYVPTTMSASEIGEEFKKFGKLKPDGVAIRTRKASMVMDMSSTLKEGDLTKTTPFEVEEEGVEAGLATNKRTVGGAGSQQSEQSRRV